MDDDTVFPALLESLLRTPAPSGREGPVADLVAKSMPPGVEVSHDAIGSLLLRAPGRLGERPRLAILGHMDEVGLMVMGIDDDGMLAIGPVGHVVPETFVAQRIRILTAAGEVLGVIGREPGWFPGTDYEPALAAFPSMRIDIGARDRHEAAQLVQIGDAAVVDVEPIRLANGHVASRSFDDRFGVYVAAEVVRRLVDAGGPPADVVGIGTVQEETALAGARTAPYAAEPDLAIAVDVDYAAPAPREHGWPADGLGAGVVVMRGTVVDDHLAGRLIRTAVAEGIPHLIRAYPGESQTDADAAAVTRSGVPTAVVSIPLRNMHTPVEVAQLADIEACVRLLVAFAGSIDPEG
jgi:putative aminopeptidase FrvX